MYNPPMTYIHALIVFIFLFAYSWQAALFVFLFPFLLDLLKTIYIHLNKTVTPH